MIFETLNSTYEHDPAGRRIRRLKGVNGPTPRQGADGEWKHYAMISEVQVGESVIIVWTISDDVAGATQTSLVQSIMFQ